MISTVDMRVDYDDVTAVQDMDLEIGEGEVFGLIGPNGAGKTSTIRVLATLQRPTYGEVAIGGIDALERPRDVHRVLGYMPDMPPVFDDLKCWEFLDLFASAYFVDRRDRRRRVEECLHSVALQQKRNAMAGTLSRGMTQRLVLAKTILPEPRVLLLDEPASGIDPIARIELRDLLKRFGEEGRTVLVSSHILTELAEMCTSIGIMEKGRLLISGNIDEIVERLSGLRKILIDVVDPATHGEALRRALEGRGNLEENKGRFTLEFSGGEREVAELLRELVAGGLPIRNFNERRMGVEDILLQVGAREVS